MCLAGCSSQIVEEHSFRTLDYLTSLCSFPDVTLGPGVCLDMRLFGVASVLGLLLLPPATQVCGKRVFGMTEGIDGVW